MTEAEKPTGLTEKPTGLTCPLCQESIGFGQLLKRRKDGKVVHVICEFELERQIAAENPNAEELYNLLLGKDSPKGHKLGEDANAERLYDLSQEDERGTGGRFSF